MSDSAVAVRWESDLRFEAIGRGGMPFVVDGDAAAGPSPVEMLLMALAGCMAVDVVDILGKMRVPLSGLTVHAEADRRSDPPRRLMAIRLTYRTEGVPRSESSKVRRAVDLSQETYCSVLHSLQPDIDVEVLIDDG
jgi:putative redox protein